MEPLHVVCAFVSGVAALNPACVFASMSLGSFAVAVLDRMSSIKAQRNRALVMLSVELVEGVRLQVDEVSSVSEVEPLTMSQKLLGCCYSTLVRECNRICCEETLLFDRELNKTGDLEAVKSGGVGGQ